MSQPPSDQIVRSKLFPPTQWSVVLKARGLESPEARLAWTELFTGYWMPLYVFARWKGFGREDSEDITQSFFLRIMSSDGLASAQAEKGKLRTFLLAALQNFLINERSRRGRLKRGGEVDFVPLDFAYAEAQFQFEAAEGLTPEVAYEKKWALSIMEDALRTLRDEFEAKGRAAIFAGLQPYLVNPSEAGYPEAAAALGLTAGNFRIMLFRARQRYKAIFRAKVANTLADTRDLREEMNYILGLFVK